MAGSSRQLLDRPRVDLPDSRTGPAAAGRRPERPAAPPSGALCAGLVAAAWLLFGLLPIQLGVAARLGLDDAQTSSWLAGVWAAVAVATLVATLRYRQPILFAVSNIGVIYIGATAGSFSFPEVVGACAVAGLLFLVGALTGLDERVQRVLPLPIVLGALVGGVLPDLARVAQAGLAGDPVVAAAVGGYVLARARRWSAVPPVAVAFLLGTAALLVVGLPAAEPIVWRPPSLVLPEVALTVPAVVTLALPIWFLTATSGNLVSLGLLRAHGYRPPTRQLCTLVGLTTLLSAAVGSAATNLSRGGTAVVVSPDAGPPEGRYRASLVAALAMLALVLGAGTVAGIAATLPRAFLGTLAALALLPTLQSSLEQALRSPLRLGALTAVAVAALPASMAGLPPAFWALPAGWVVAALVERPSVRAAWRAATG